MARQSNVAAVPVLLTRPEAEARRFAQQLNQRFGGRLRPVVAPLMAAVHLTPGLPAGPFAGVIFTSATGVDAAVRLATALPRLAWCVGAKTADRAAKAGFRARSADGDARALVAAILADPPAGRLLHLRGQETRGEVAERLNSAGIETESAVVYRQVPQALTDEAQRLLNGGNPVIVPLFSPRSAALFAAQAQGAQADLHLVAISPAVAEVVRNLPHRSLALAARPDAAAMLDAIAAVLDALPPP
ncbi:uroporphyrinogen-III synthase [Tabrizicola caldifontis]|uniref:uroporphyrinogen-III synthase n=1 Tax=Tabrizicola caldifontis TaxID=2528036 RepID=UPI00108086E8|nr:uroporphyrinogen-III synthase [Rhodobacter sp. YIM 73028]